MKGLITVFLAAMLAVNLSAQDTVSHKEKVNELKLNLAITLAEIAEISYERIINDDIGVGLSTAYSFNEFDNFRGMVLPYFRFYPSQKQKAWGFFLEANAGMIISDEDLIFENSLSNQNSTDSKSQFGFGLGFAIGGKWVTDSGLFGEVFLGLGREFNDESYIEGYPRLGLNFGWRF
jgi:hypothetical protein